VDRVAALLLLAVSLALGWQSAAPLPQPRSEVAATAYGNDIAVVGGFLPDGASANRVDLYSPIENRWTRLPDLPIAVNHAMAAADPARLYVVGGYTSGFGRKLRSAYVFDRASGAWRGLPPMPGARAAGGAAIVDGKLYVVGGVGTTGLAGNMFVFDPLSRRWAVLPGPTPREHLAIATSGTRLYALGGRTAGFDTNLSTFEEFRPGSGWQRLPRLPAARGGTGAAFIGGKVVSIGGEAPGGTIRSVYAFDLARRRWSRLPDLPTPRHGLGVVAVDSRIYAVGGGPQPGLSTSGANEFLTLE
jgi:N-acetylneuraminic acid mutarotase